MGERHEAFGWAPVWTNTKPHPFILMHAVRETRTEAQECVGLVWRPDDWRKGWRMAYRRGCRCFRVRVNTFGEGR